MSFYLSINIGTTSAKVTLYNQQGEIAYSLSMKYAITYPKTGWAEEDPDDWWDATTTLTQQLVYTAGKQSIRAVGVSGQAPSCILWISMGKR
jgi:xylulokinase